MESLKKAAQENPTLAVCTVVALVMLSRVMRYLTTVNDGK
jgi:hypothetical protein